MCFQQPGTHESLHYIKVQVRIKLMVCGNFRLVLFMHVISCACRHLGVIAVYLLLCHRARQLGYQDM